MKNNNRLIFFLILGISIPLVVGLRLHFNSRHSHDSLNTSMDVQAIESLNVTPDPELIVDSSEQRTAAAVPEVTASQVIDTLPSVEGQAVQKIDNEDALKRKQVVSLVDEALSYIEKNTLDKAMSAFTHGRDFIRGELYLFVYDMNGFLYGSGLDERFIWKNWHNQQDQFGTYMVQEMIKKAKEGGGWTTYQWRNATKLSYVKRFVKDGKEFLVGAGYYPHSKRDIVVGLVKAAASYFNDVVIQKGFLVDEVFSTLSYPAGRFVFGDLYLYAVRFDGQMMANGDRPGLIGTNVLNVADSQGKLVNKEIIDKLKKTDLGVWVEYRSKNATKLAYAQKVTDKAGNNYFIACGYHPDVKPEKAVDLVKSGYEFMKKHGLSAAVSEFSHRQADAYRYGDLYLAVWNLKGTVVAHGANLDTLGVNQFDLKDEDGRFYVRDIIEKALHGGGWVDFKLKNAFQSMYVEKIELGTDDFVIGSGLYPVSKREMALLLARSAASYLRSNSDEEAFAAFSDTNGKFIRGDLYVFVIGFDGICKVWGDTYELIWRQVQNAKDDSGKPYVQIFINTSKEGPGQVTYKINGYERVALLELVEKNRQSYVVGVSYNI